MQSKINPIEGILESAGVAPTPVRILVYRCLKESDSPLSLAEIETLLDSVDKSTVSRTLSIFKKNHLVHSFNDGSGSVKYEPCRSPLHFESDMHVHFRCEICGKTVCLNAVKVPDVDLPTGYVMKSVNYVVTGICDKCNLKN